jgi:hypothetical protein
MAMPGCCDTDPTGEMAAVISAEKSDRWSIGSSHVEKRFGFPRQPQKKRFNSQAQWSLHRFDDSSP